MTDERVTIRVDDEALIRHAYASFNSKDIDAALADMVRDVDWPNMIEGTRLTGHDAVGASWAGQFATTNPEVVPTGFRAEGDATVASVRQTVRDLQGNVLLEGDVEHVYRFRDGKVARMDVRVPT
jgi:ketosteroid isomerase-like protein